MTFDEFKTIVISYMKKKPNWFYNKMEERANKNDIDKAERKLGIMLPIKYKEFVREYGGGDFAFINVFSVDENGEWYICKKNKELECCHNNKNFVAISDDQTGGFYGYILNNSIVNEDIYYLDLDTNKFTNIHKDIFEYIIESGLNYKLHG